MVNKKSAHLTIHLVSITI